MAEQIRDGQGSHNQLVITNSGAALVTNKDTSPNDSSRNNPAFQFIYLYSGTSTGVTGSRIGSVIMFIGAGSFIDTLTYSNNRIIRIGSWS